MALAVKLAVNYKKEQQKENFPANNLSSSLIGDNNSRLDNQEMKILQQFEESIIEDQKIGEPKPLEERKGNNLKPSNLNKRKPELKKPESKPLKKMEKPAKIEKPTSIMCTPATQTALQVGFSSVLESPPEPEFKRQSGPLLQSIEKLNNETEVNQFVVEAEKLADQLAELRGVTNPESSMVADVLSGVVALCDISRLQPAARVKQLLHLRFGCYLKVMESLIALLPSGLCAQRQLDAKAALEIAFGQLVRKGFGFDLVVIDGACSQTQSNECSTQTYSQAQAPIQSVKELVSPPTESLLSPSEPVQQPLDNNASEFQSTTVKLEDTGSREGVQFRLRRKVCRKIRAILVDHLSVKISHAESITLSFEEAIFRACPELSEYIQAIKTACSRVKVLFALPEQKSSNLFAY